MNEPDHEQDCEKYSKSPVLGSKMHYDPVVLVQKHGRKKKQTEVCSQVTIYIQNHSCNDCH